MLVLISVSIIALLSTHRRPILKVYLLTFNLFFLFHFQTILIATDSNYFGVYFCGLFVTWSLFIICLLFSELQRNSFLWILPSHSYEFLNMNFVRHEKYCFYLINMIYSDYYKVLLNTVGLYP